MTPYYDHAALVRIKELEEKARRYIKASAVPGWDGAEYLDSLEALRAALNGTQIVSCSRCHPASAPEKHDDCRSPTCKFIRDEPAGDVVRMHRLMPNYAAAPDEWDRCGCHLIEGGEPGDYEHASFRRLTEPAPTATKGKP